MLSNKKKKACRYKKTNIFLFDNSQKINETWKYKTGINIIPRWANFQYKKADFASFVMLIKSTPKPQIPTAMLNIAQIAWSLDLYFLRLKITTIETVNTINNPDKENKFKFPLTI